MNSGRGHQVLLSEEGLIGLTEGAVGLPPVELARKFRELVSADMEWVRFRKLRYRRLASVVKIGSLALTSGSALILGLQDLGPWPSIAFSMVIVVTALNAIDAFYNWRPRWVALEESKYQLNRLRDEIDYYLASTGPEEVDRRRLDEFFADRQAIWSDVNKRWVEFRAVEEPPPHPGIPR
jgi:hypothetical protein